MGYQDFDEFIFANSLPDTLIIRLIPKIQLLSEVQVQDSYVLRVKKEDARSVDVVGADYIRQHLSGSLIQSLERLPGLHGMDIGSGQSKPLIRGLGFNRIVVAENGVKHEAQQWGADHGLEIDQFSVERLEVIRGPSSLKYGSDAIGGLIEASQDKIPEPGSSGGLVDLAGNSNNESLGGSFLFYHRRQDWYIKTHVSLTDYADYRVPVDSVTINSYRIPLENNRLRNTAGEVIHGGLTIGRLGKRCSLSLFLSDYFTKTGFFANAHGIMPLNTDSSYDRSIRDIQLPYQWVNHAKAILRTTVFTGKTKTELDLGWQYNYRRELNQYYQHGYMPPVLPDTLNFLPDLAREFKKQTLSLNYRVAFRVWENHSLTLGVSGEYQHNRIAGWDFIIPSYDQTSGGIFLLDKVHLSGKLILEAGIRADIGYLSIFPYTDWFQTPVIVDQDTLGFRYAPRAQSLKRLFGNLSWSAGLNYSISSLTLRVNTGKSYRMPIPKELAVNGLNYHYFIFEKGDPGLSPEVSYQLDAGLDWHRPTFAMEISPFVNYFPNYIYLNPTYRYDYIYGAGNQLYEYYQCEVFRTGGELHLHYKPFRFLMAGMIAEYVWARQLSGEKKGFSLPYSPPASVVLNLKYLPAFRSLFEHAFLSLDINLTAPRDQIVPPEIKTPGSVTLDIGLGTDLVFPKQRLSIAMTIRNLLNAVYYNATSFYRILDIPEPGRSLTLTITVPFSFSTLTQ